MSNSVNMPRLFMQMMMFKYMSSGGGCFCGQGNNYFSSPYLPMPSIWDTTPPTINLGSPYQSNWDLLNYYTDLPSWSIPGLNFTRSSSSSKDDTDKKTDESGTTTNESEASKKYKNLRKEENELQYAERLNLVKDLTLSGSSLTFANQDSDAFFNAVKKLNSDNIFPVIATWNHQNPGKDFWDNITDNLSVKELDSLRQTDILNGLATALKNQGVDVAQSKKNEAYYALSALYDEADDENKRTLVKQAVNLIASQIPADLLKEQEDNLYPPQPRPEYYDALGL